MCRTEMGRLPHGFIFGNKRRAGSVGPFRLVVMVPLGLHGGAAEVRARERFGGHDEVMDGRVEWRVILHRSRKVGYRWKVRQVGCL